MSIQSSYIEYKVAWLKFSNELKEHVIKNKEIQNKSSTFDLVHYISITKGIDIRFHFPIGETLPTLLYVSNMDIDCDKLCVCGPVSHMLSEITGKKVIIDRDQDDLEGKDGGLYVPITYKEKTNVSDNSEDESD